MIDSLTNTTGYRNFNFKEKKENNLFIIFPSNVLKIVLNKTVALHFKALWFPCGPPHPHPHKQPTNQPQHNSKQNHWGGKMEKEGLRRKGVNIILVPNELMFICSRRGQPAVFVSWLAAKRWNWNHCKLLTL